MAMGRALLALFLIVPIIEIALFVLLGDLIGFWWTMAGVVVTAVIGSLLLRWQGLAVLDRIRTDLARNSLPARPIMDGLMMAIAGALLLTPGFFTDTIGFLLFVPAVRSAIFRFLRSRIEMVELSPNGPEQPRRGFQGVDLDVNDWREAPDDGR
jgi:UPF0716 protein FxsA